MTKDDRRTLHIGMFPWLAFGHMIPFLNLSKQLAQKGYKVSYISTPRNIDRLPRLPSEFASSISFVKLPLPKVENLPDNAEATTDICNEEMDYLKRAYDGLEPGLTRFLDESSLDWIIYDFCTCWLPPIATRLGISCGMFFIFNAWFLSYMEPVDSIFSGSDDRSEIEDFMVPPKWINFETKVTFKRFQAHWVRSACQNNQSGMTDFHRLAKATAGSEVILVRHSYEFEPKWLHLLQELYKKPVIPIGLMPPNVTDSTDTTNVEAWIPIKEWLDGHDKSSVVYVALGSEVVISQDQLTELALGLDLSGVKFFWVLREVSGLDVELPSGFEERVRGRGIVWRKWAPQLQILNHESIGGFLTHCGWSSTIEGLMFGHPLITLPFLIDQGLNSRVIVDQQLGAEVERNEEDGSYTRESVAKSIKIVMLETTTGGMFRKKAGELRDVINDHDLQDRYTDNFIKFLEHSKNISIDNA